MSNIHRCIQQEHQVMEYAYRNTLIKELCFLRKRASGEALFLQPYLLSSSKPNRQDLPSSLI